MSLFKARDWWGTTCGTDEEFDKGCICVCNIDNSPDGSAKIVVGSFAGILRIYKPQPVKLENGSYSGFRADDLLLETQLNAPILQVQPGLLVTGLKTIHLAVLHPFKLIVYTIAAVQGTVDHGTYYNLSLAYEHPLQRHAFSMIIGPFGYVKEKDIVCIQSLDSTLNFFEQESFAFSRYLPNALLPGPITYVPKTDTFIIASGFSLECYRFQVLAMAADESSDNGINKNFMGKKVAFDWSYNIGEGILDVLTVDDKIQQSTVLLVLGEKTLFVLSPNGKLKFAKKLNFSPISIMAHNDGIDSSLIILIATTKQTLLVFREKCLKWAAQLNFCPVCICRSNFMSIKGLLVLLSAQGNLACCYLGTEPSLFISPMVEPKEIDFSQAEKEMQELKNKIKTSNQNLLGSQQLGNEISLSINLPQRINPVIDENSETRNLYGAVPSVTVKIQMKCATAVHDVRLMVHVDPPLTVSQKVHTFGSVSNHNLSVVIVSFNSVFCPSNLKLTVHVVYTNSQGIPRVFESSAHLPFTLVAKACPPSKTAEHKITFEIDKKVIPASELFTDLSPDSASVTGGAMGIEYYSGQQITIMPSKSAQKYRMQSDVFPALWLVLSELIKRLKEKYKKDQENSKMTIIYSSPLPLHEYFSVIEEHFEIRQQMSEMEVLLGQRAEQFRVVQKRLLTKMKDKTPTPLNNLDTLLEATHRHILTLMDSLMKHAAAHENSCCSLTCATQLILMLLQLSSNMKEDEFAFVTACFSPIIDLESHQGWEENVNVALTFLMKFCLGKTGTDLGLADSNLDMPKDLVKLKKHISFVCDQISKGTEIDICGSSLANAENSNSSNRKNIEHPLADELTIPIGSKFADTNPTRSDEFLEDHKLLSENFPDVFNDSSSIQYNDLSEYPDDGEEMII